uniref:Uncharacterized protein n=1 Tax=Setaria italica TaxID=4555 RepID=K4A4C1_SETIT
MLLDVAFVCLICGRSKCIFVMCTVAIKLMYLCNSLKYANFEICTMSLLL